MTEIGGVGGHRQIDGHARLREPFPPEHIGQLPKRDKYGGLVFLDFVGHAHVTSRLLEVDQDWNWEPLSWRPDGLPLLDGNGGLWIKLTVLGVTRLGYGHADGRTNGDAVKEIIGDAIRNAAMRFGVALDLWARERPEEPGPDRRGGEGQRDRGRPDSGRSSGDVAESRPADSAHPANKYALAALKSVCDEHGYDARSVAARFFTENQVNIRAAESGLIEAFAAKLIQEATPEPDHGAAGPDSDAGRGDLAAEAAAAIARAGDAKAAVDEPEAGSRGEQGGNPVAPVRKGKPGWEEPLKEPLF